MTLLYYTFVALFVAVIASDWLLARRIRKAIESRRLDLTDFERSPFGGPLGIALNLFRFRKIPPANDLSDPDHIAIRRHHRTHQVLVVLLAVCIAAALLRRIAA
jgi:hypothetical protein